MGYIPDPIRNAQPNPDTLKAAADRLNANMEAIKAELEFLSPFLPQYQAQHGLLALAPGSRTVLRLPPEMLDIGGHRYCRRESLDLDINLPANWDDSSLATPENRRGKDLRVYACWPGSGGLAPDYVLSANSTFPNAKNADNSRARGGWHAMCAPVGVISGHPFSGYQAGDVMDTSIWCPGHMPASLSPNGMAYVAPLDEWWDIYPQSGSGTSTASAWNGVITDSRNLMDFVDDQAAAGKHLPDDLGYQVAAALSNEQTNIYLSEDPVRTGKIGIKTFAGTGLNDLAFDRTSWFHSMYAQEYEFTIDGTGSPNTLKWRKRNLNGTWSAYTEGVAITGAAQAIADGLTSALATTGHTLGDKWTIACMEAFYDTSGRAMISAYGLWGMAGVQWHWTRTHGTRVDNTSFAWQWYDLPDAKGDFYCLSPYGTINLLAGGYWSNGSSCGSRARSAADYRWVTYSSLGARGCARSLKAA